MKFKLAILILLITFSQRVLAEGFEINTQNREEVRNFFNTVYQASENVPMGWTGNTAQCIPGTTSQEYRDAVALRINFFRAMAGVPADITLNDEFNRKAQQAALMMSANDQSDHFPPSSWTCYTEEGAEAAGKSNLYLGRAGPQAIFGHMRDEGESNKPVGHRRWILYPLITKMGTGNVDVDGEFGTANALWVQDTEPRTSRPSTRDEFVIWPPNGFVPYQLVFPRWSFSYPDADFSSTTVTMEQQGEIISLQIVHQKEKENEHFGDNTLVWEPNVSFSTAPTTDISYSVTVNNVLIDGTPRNFNYMVTVINPSVLSADSIFPTISGDSQPVVNQDNVYSFNTVPNATGYQLLQANRQAFTQTEGAESGMGSLNAEVSDYQVIAPDIQASGSTSFHLAHPETKDQILTFNHIFLPTDSSQLNFSSRLGLASPMQIAKVQVSTDDGQTWQDIFIQPGTDDSGESNFSLKTVSLSQFAKQAIQLRFNYFYKGGTYYPQTDSGIGWYIDDISFTNVEELSNQTLTDIPLGNSFTFNPPQIGDYALQLRAKVYEKYPLEWGTTQLVTAQLATSDEIVTDDNTTEPPTPPTTDDNTTEPPTPPTTDDNADEIELAKYPVISEVYSLEKTGPLENSTAQFYGGISLNDSEFQLTNESVVRLNDTITVSGIIVPEQTHVGQQADILVVGLYTPDSNNSNCDPQEGSYYMNTGSENNYCSWIVEGVNAGEYCNPNAGVRRQTVDSYWQRWSGNLTELVPLYTVTLTDQVKLTAEEGQMLYRDKPDYTGYVCLNFGYRLHDPSCQADETNCCQQPDKNCPLIFNGNTINFSVQE